MLRGALPTITFLSHIRKVAFRVWTFTWTESGHDSLRPPNQRHHRAKRVRARRQTQAKSIGRLFMLVTMVPKMQLFLPIRCGCFSVYRELKNASWMPNFGFTVEVYVWCSQCHVACLDLVDFRPDLEQKKGDAVLRCPPKNTESTSSIPGYRHMNLCAASLLYFLRMGGIFARKWRQRKSTKHNKNATTVKWGLQMKGILH